MPVSKPTNVPTWATAPGPSSGITEPSSGKKANGWDVNEKPAAQYFNWFWNLVCLWIAWLNDITNQALTWAALQKFETMQFGSAGQGAMNVGTSGAKLGAHPSGDSALTFETQAPAVVRRRLVDLGTTGASGEKVVVYASAVSGYGSIEYAINCTYNHGTGLWNRVNGAFPMRVIRIGGDQLSLDGAPSISFSKINSASAGDGTMYSQQRSADYPYIQTDFPTFHRVGAGGGEPAFAANWTVWDDGGGTKAAPIFWKDHMGVVHMQGGAETSVDQNVGTLIFTLPLGYRPNYDMVVSCTNLFDGTSDFFLYVQTDGTVTAYWSPAGLRHLTLQWNFTFHTNVPVPP